MPDDPASGSTRTWRWVASDEKSAHTVFLAELMRVRLIAGLLYSLFPV